MTPSSPDALMFPEPYTFRNSPMVSPVESRGVTMPTLQYFSNVHVTVYSTRTSEFEMFHGAAFVVWSSKYRLRRASIRQM